MLSIYFLCLCIFPVLALVQIRLSHKEEGNSVLLPKNDTNVLRGVSACCVVIAHYCRWVNEIQEGMNGVFYALVSQLGGIGVLIFFFVSGYGIYESHAGTTASFHFLWKRAKSVYFPYLIMKILFGIAFLVIECTPPDIGIHTLTPILLPEDWFIQVILIQYIAFFLCWKLARETRIITYSFLLDIAISFVFMVIGRQGSWLNALWLFTFGMMCSCHKKRICMFFIKSTWRKIFLLFLTFCMLGCLFALNKEMAWANIFKPISGAFLCLGICGLLRKITFSSGIMTYLGKRSMYLYIVHINIWNLLARWSNVIQRFWVALVLSLVITEGMYQITKFIMGGKFNSKFKWIRKHTT